LNRDAPVGGSLGVPLCRRAESRRCDADFLVALVVRFTHPTELVVGFTHPAL